jgi:NADPH-dependent 2,4-dienoyl-CoA reductase/sulfur reductase-like enzyme
MILIVGAGAGGTSAAFSARETGYEGDIVLVGADPRPPYERPYLSKEFMRDEIGDRNSGCIQVRTTLPSASTFAPG